jgi:hypothetical protein
VTAPEIVAAVLAHVEKAWQHQRTPIAAARCRSRRRRDGVVREENVDPVDQIAQPAIDLDEVAVQGNNGLAFTWSRHDPATPAS